MKKKEPGLKVIVHGEASIDNLLDYEQRAFYSTMLSRIQELHAQDQQEATTDSNTSATTED